MPKIVRFHEVGGPEKLRIEDVPSQQPGYGEIRMRVLATGLNRAELTFVRGSYFEKPELPSRVGVEAVGIVEAVGEDVDPELIGKSVSTLSGFSQSKYGVLGEEAVVPVVALARCDGNLSSEQEAAVWISFLTAWGAVIRYAQVTPDDFVMIPAASSSVGLAATQLVKDAGGVVIALTRKADKREQLLALGANHVIVTDEEDLPRRVDDITSGRGVRITFDPVGGPYIEKLFEAAAPGGTVLLYGGLSGEPSVFPIKSGLMKALSLRGYSMAEVRADPDVLKAGQRYLRERFRDGRLAPKIAGTFPLAQVADAYRYLESNTHVGKIVITI